MEKATKRELIFLILGTVLSFTVYKTLIYYGELTDNTFYSFLVMLAYMVVLLGFIIGYMVYNRFLYRKGVTSDQLPREWGEEKKAEFIADGERRLKKSRWVMLVIFPLVFTFFLDALDIFVFDMFRR